MLVISNHKEIQKSLIEITAQAGLTQIHEEPTREKNLLDLVFTSNATQTKSSTNIPGISDHAIIIRHGHKTIPRKSYIWRKANWPKIEDLEHLTDEIKKTKKQANTEELWIIFKDSLQQSMDKKHTIQTNKIKQ